MKKYFVIFMLITTSAFAAVIDANTKIKWNATVVVTALKDTGLRDYGVHDEVVATYNGILADLLERDKFSVSDAVALCMQQCNKSDLLKNGRGDSGRKCPEICDDFGTALIDENNKDNKILVSAFGSVSGNVYSKDKKFYAMSSTVNKFDKFSDWSSDPVDYTNVCDWSVFETDTNTKIAKCASYKRYDHGEGNTGVYIDFNVTDQRYAGYNLSVDCYDIDNGMLCELKVNEAFFNGRIYSDDKQFYVNGSGNVVDVNAAVFESKTNRKIAEPGMRGAYREGEAYVYFNVVDPKYDGHSFKLFCDYLGDGDCRLELEKVSGRIYTKDNNFYMFKRDGSSFVFETATNKPIAVFEYVQKENSMEMLQQVKILDAKYNGYVGEFNVYTNLLSFQTAENAQKEKENDYYNKWLDLKKCLDEYRKVDFPEIKELISLDVSSAWMETKLDSYYARRDFADELNLNKFRSTSYDLADEMNIIYREYCELPSVKEMVNELSEIKRDITSVTMYFLNSRKKFANVQTETLQDAIEIIEDNIPDIQSSSYVDLSKLRCDGECKKFGQDYVTCTLGKIKGTFEFDDICDGDKFRF